MLGAVDPGMWSLVSGSSGCTAVWARPGLLTVSGCSGESRRTMMDGEGEGGGWRMSEWMGETSMSHSGLHCAGEGRCGCFGDAGTGRVMLRQYPQQHDGG